MLRRFRRFILSSILGAGLLAALALPSLAMQPAQGFCEVGGQLVQFQGQGLQSTSYVQASYPQCTVTVTIHGGGLATIFSDNSSTPLSNPFTADTDGSWQFYAATGRYDITLSNAGFVVPFTISDVVLQDAIGNIFPSPPPIGNVTPNTGTFTVLTSTGGALNGTVGATTPAAGAFTTLTATGSSTLGATVISALSTPGQIVSTLSTGTPPFSISSTTAVANLNASLLLGNTWASPGAIGTVTPGNATFLNIIAKVRNNVRYADQFSGADIGAKINAAFADCSNDCVVFVAAGTWPFSTTINWPIANFGQTTLACDQGAQLNYTGSSDALFANGTGNQTVNGRITNCQIAGTSSGSSGVHIKALNGFNLDHVYVNGFSTGDGFKFEGANTVDCLGCTANSNKNGVHNLCTTVSATNYSTNAVRWIGGQASFNSQWGWWEDAIGSISCGVGQGNTVTSVFDLNGSGSSGGNIYLQAVVGDHITGSYLEYNSSAHGPANIQIGDGTNLASGNEIDGNVFISQSTTSSINCSSGHYNHIQGNTEFSAVTNWFNTAVGCGNNYIGFNNTAGAATNYIGGSATQITTIDPAGNTFVQGTFRANGATVFPTSIAVGVGQALTGESGTGNNVVTDNGPSISGLTSLVSVKIGASGTTISDSRQLAQYSATLSTTAAASDNISITGVTSSSHCVLAATNVSAATNIATTYISAKTTNQITVTHTATASMTYDILCTAN